MTAGGNTALYEDASRSWGLVEADALTLLTKLPENSVDAVLTDPPWGIGFHNEAWDGKDLHRAAGGGPLSTGEALQRFTARWASECRRILKPGGHLVSFGAPRTFHRLVAGVEEADLEIRDQLLWMFGQGVPKSRRLPGGRGTALKPAYEPILLARAPLAGSTADTLAAWGTGALNIEAARVAGPKNPAGYWPANVVLSHAPDCPVPLIDGGNAERSRLFYCAKAYTAEREAGCEDLPLRSDLLYSRPSPRLRRNVHPTVKPVDLMRWLVRLITPMGGLVLDPFTGSGTTGIAALLEERMFLGIERESRYVDIACARLAHWAPEPKRPT